MPDPPPYKELLIGRSLVGAVTRGGWFEPARLCALGAGGAVFASPRSMTRHTTATRDPFLDLDQ